MIKFYSFLTLCLQSLNAFVECTPHPVRLDMFFSKYGVTMLVECDFEMMKHLKIGKKSSSSSGIKFNKHVKWGVVMQLVQRLLLTPEIHVSNSVIGNFIFYQMYKIKAMLVRLK